LAERGDAEKLAVSCLAGEMLIREERKDLKTKRSKVGPSRRDRARRHQLGVVLVLYSSTTDCHITL